MEEAWLTLQGDLNRNMQFEQLQVLFTASKLLVLDREGRQILHIPKQNVENIRLIEALGGGYLVASTAKGPVEILRFTEMHLDSCRKALSRVEQWASKDSFTTDKRNDLKDRNKTCAHCGRVMRSAKDSCMRCNRKWSTVSHLLQRSRAYSASMIVMGIIVILTVLVSLAPPYIIKWIIDGISAPVGTGGVSSHLLWMSGLLAGIYILQALLQMIEGYTAISIGGRFLGELRRDMFHALMKQSMRFFDNRQVSQYIGRINQDTDTIKDFMSQGIVHLTSQLLSALFILGMLFYLDWRMTLMILIPLPPLGLFVMRLWPKVREMWYSQWQSSIHVQNMVGEALQGIRIIKAFSKENDEKERFDKANSRFVNRMISIQNLWMFMTPVLTLFISLFVALIWFAGGRKVLEGGMTVGTLSAYATYLIMFFGPVKWLAQSASWINEVLGSAERIFEVIHTPAEVTDDEEAQPLSKVRGEIRYNHVGFGYAQDRRILHGIDLHIAPGEMIGLIGPSGAGKSTLIHLLCRFYDPDEGEILLDGRRLSSIRQEELRKNIGVVFQETFLFDGTIAQNIAYGNPEAEAQDIIQAAMTANAHDFICRLPHGYETKVGERGHRLSGGERQRIAIARAVLLDPPILILDEATSSVDVETEAAIQEAMDKVIQGRTTIVIAHRLSTLQRADRLLVLEGGRLVESGSHEELLNRGGVYHRLLHAAQGASGREVWIPMQEVAR
ncbi:ABC transporter ATP-binding protein [Paenibacillus glucanolyticus]|uniref:ABC transporter ATP-binding protein n=1 Tax=Paenibacillus glucanolyticus TaxID=59843 RepID=UPI0030C9B337